ncbi:MAG: hypothetical protein IT372_13595 [Polyangiaceae bacterium]|nr:hypothetical protein [Polyangiaceae bacterium]
MTHRHLALGLSGLLLAASLTGCLRKQDDEADQQLAEDAAALSWEGSKSSGLGRAVLSPVQAADTQDADTAASSYETRPVAGFYPAGCVSSTRSGASVHVQFDDCTGPFGLVHLSGGIDAAFSLRDGTLHAELVDSGDLTVQGNPVDYAASTDITIDAAGYVLAWNASWDGTTGGGEPFAHDSDLDIAADPDTGCVTLGGTSSGSVSDRGMDSVIEGYSVCPAECPSAGRITSTGKKSGRTVVVEFDGSTRAQVTLPSGDVVEVPLVCGAAR